MDNICMSSDLGKDSQEIIFNTTNELDVHNDFEFYDSEDSFNQTAQPTSVLNITSAHDSVLNINEKYVSPTIMNKKPSETSEINTDFVAVIEPVFYASTPNNSILSVNTNNVHDLHRDEVLTTSQEASANVINTQHDSSRLNTSEEVKSLDKMDDYSLITKNVTSNTTNCVVNTTSERRFAELKIENSDDDCKSQVSFDSGNERSSHKYFIDLSSLPDSLPPKKTSELDNAHEKSKIFNIFVDLGDKAPVKEMPTRLSSALNVKRQIDKSQPAQEKPNKNSKIMNAEKRQSALTEKTTLCNNSTLSEFEAIEALCNDPNISLTEIIHTPKTKKNKNEKTSLSQEPFRNHSEQSKSAICKEVFQKADSYVKLSDLDNPVSQTDLSEHLETANDVRMTRSIPDNNWRKQYQSTCVSIGLLSSFHSENALSLNRLFPNLKNDISRSMPGSLSARTSLLKPGIVPSPGETDEPNMTSDVSEISSVQSSTCRSIVESTTEESSHVANLIVNCQSRLGQDLLRMFIEEIAPDVIVEVAGKRIKAHKCILSSRCQYFARMLSGGWVESAGNVITLSLFSFEAVHFVLCHIYSGTSDLPDSIRIVELAAMADMLGLEGLKEAIMVKLKVTYCHNFHTPCSICIVGVVECLPLSAVYGLDDLYRKILRWMTKYFATIWPTKPFATLPKELLEKCYQEHVVNLSIDNFLDTVYGCGSIVGILENTKWAEKVAQMCRRLVNAAAHFAAPKLVQILELIATVPNDSAPLAKQALKDCLTAAIEWAPPGETCKAYAFLSNLVKIIRSKADLILNVNGKVADPDNLLYTNANNWRLQCENTLVRAAPRVVSTQAFKDLPTELRKRLRELGCIVYGHQANPTFSPIPGRYTKTMSQTKPCEDIIKSLDMEHVRKSFVPYKPKPYTVTTEKVKCEREKKKPILVRTTRAQEKRAIYNMSKTGPAKSNSQNPSAKTPRYLDPNSCKDTKMPQKNFINKVMSSTESSRNSSPVLKRNEKKQGKAMSEDSLATTSRPRTAEPSTDSLSESQSNKYGTYTKTKHALKGSVESVTTQHSISSNRNTTKIPLYSYAGSKTESQCRRQIAQNEPKTNKTQSCRMSTNIPKPKISFPGSLMMATKASSAKIVTKVVKEPVKTKKVPKKVKDVESRPIGRSGTFLKDEPTFSEESRLMSK
ncbi:uncharacterized protein LOC125062524 isoform X1 [Pieris napi]|uniref:uncharacterized protein LOC125062524 isoform X1 n=1 Tax=Pieris napi TaxID=78633 RepID=UPI001FB9D368|nr:uncharacterized protein LOC125062524 isoform X1 [Pieris napi]XP_047524473.1 uncharacterized protein LOC125062524 isoform X1 [Pieris napi]XP_047524474.1 uncharacterized protein LOC125062524 isoform X1 [Pieris napi]